MYVGVNDIHQSDIGFQKVDGCIVARKFSNLCRYINYKIPLSILQIELRKNIQERDKSVLDLKVRIWVDNIHFQKS